MSFGDKWFGNTPAESKTGFDVEVLQKGKWGFYRHRDSREEIMEEARKAADRFGEDNVRVKSGSGFIGGFTNQK